MASYLANYRSVLEHQYFDVESNEELHNILQGLPLYPYMDIEVMALNRHPSSVRDDDS